MKIVTLGAGPAGLYSALLLKKLDSNHEITILERNPRGATYGWGVVFSDQTLNAFREADYTTYTQITAQFVVWEAIDLWYRGQLVRCGGHGFAGNPALDGHDQFVAIQLRGAQVGAIGHLAVHLAAVGCPAVTRLAVGFLFVDPQAGGDVVRRR